MDNHLHYLSANKIKLITGYYLIANLIGVALPGLVLISQNNPGFDLFYRLNTTTALILGIVGTSLMGTSIYYLNKIYKSSVFKGGKSPEKSTQHVGERGAVFYYLSRPLIAIGCSALIIIGLKFALPLITRQETKLDQEFLYLSMCVSFLVGLSAGRLFAKFHLFSKYSFSKFSLRNTKSLAPGDVNTR